MQKPGSWRRYVLTWAVLLLPVDLLIVFCDVIGTDTLPPVLNELCVHRHESATHSVIASAQLPQRTCTLHMLHLQLLHMTGQTTICIRGGAFWALARDSMSLAVHRFAPPRNCQFTSRNFSLVHVAVVSVPQLEHVDDGVRGQLPPPSGSCCSQWHSMLAVRADNINSNIFFSWRWGRTRAWRPAGAATGRTSPSSGQR